MGNFFRTLGRSVGIIFVCVVGILVVFPVVAVMKGLTAYFKMVANVLFDDAEIEAARSKWKSWWPRKYEIRDWKK